MEKAIEKFVEQAKKVEQEMKELHRVWEYLTSDENVIAESDYPFSHSYDEMVSMVGTWIESMEENTKKVRCRNCGKFDYEMNITVIPFDCGGSSDLCKTCNEKLKVQLREESLKEVEELEKIIEENDIEKIKEFMIKAEEVITGDKSQIFGPIYFKTIQSYLKLDQEGFKFQNFHDINALDQLFLQNVSKEDIEEFVK
jgi:flagellin-specific chaperone FliS